jgi:hypothetical protein
VRAPRDDTPVLKRGEHNWKIGDRILMGRWTGLPTYTLTLEERATCPPTCLHWLDCYGNRMWRADRWQAGPALERSLRRQIEAFSIDHPCGFVVRPHILGDFYSVEYVQLWHGLLARYSTLNVWGYTARIDKGDPIAAALATLADDIGWDRFAVRGSDAPVGRPRTASIKVPRQTPPDAVICPEQLGKVKNCGACGLCFSTPPISCIGFVNH